MMMTYMKSVKNTIVNWAKENRLLAYLVAGAIGLPLLLGVGGLILTLIVFLLTLIGIGTGVAIAIVTLAVIGAIAGAAAYYYFED